MSIPGTHDSGAYGGQIGTVQDWNITGQLSAGIRYFDIRARRSGGHDLAIHHGAFYQGKGLGNILAQTQQFLKYYPHEFVIMRIKEEHTSASSALPFDDSFRRYMELYPELFLTRDELPGFELGKRYDARNLTVGDLRGRVLVLADQGFGILRSDASSRPIGIEKSGLGLFWQDDYYIEPIVGMTLKREAIFDTLDKAKQGTGDWCFNHVSAFAVETPVIGIAAVINQLVYANYLGSNPGKQSLGVVIMDHPGEKLIERIIKTNYD